MAATVIDNTALKSTRKDCEQCIACNKSFAVRHLLKQHVRAVHEKQRYSCQYCPETFAYRSGRTRHMHSQHQRIKERLDKFFHSPEPPPLTFSSRGKIVGERHDEALMLATNSSNDANLVGDSNDPNGFSNEKIDESSSSNDRVGDRSNGSKIDDVAFDDVTISGFPSSNESPIENDSDYSNSVIYNGSGSSFSSGSGSGFCSSSGSLITALAKNRLKCTMCDKTFAYTAGRSKHMRSVHERVRYQCELCDGLYTTKDYASQHVHGAHSIKFNALSYIRQVVGVNKEPNPSTTPAEKNNCAISPKPLQTVSTLKSDESESDRLRRKETAHSVVQQRPLQTVALPLKESVKPASLPFHCLQCGVGYATQESLGYHAAVEHGDDVDKMPAVANACECCGEKFLRIASLVAHVKLHHPNLCHRCTVCAEEFGCLAMGSYHVEREHHCDPEIFLAPFDRAANG